MRIYYFAKLKSDEDILGKVNRLYGDVHYTNSTSKRAKAVAELLLVACYLCLILIKIKDKKRGKKKG